MGQPSDYRPGLDGLRAIAITSVVLFHLGHVAGGNLGVDAFFVLSGWLITWKLLHDLSVDDCRLPGRLRQFWAARVRRLMPASLTVIAAVAIAWPLAGITVRSLRRDVVFATFWSSNWGTITSHGDYWARFGEPSPLSHFWSLAVEEQYYVLWPLLVAGAALIGRRALRLSAGVVAGVLAGASIAVMVAIYDPANPTATYMNTFARAHTLLIGAAAAAITRTLPDGRLRGGRTARRLAPLGAAVTIGMVAVSDERSTWLFRWGFPVFALAAAVVVVAAADGMGVVLLASRPMRWLSDRSYGLYLWHWPVFTLLSPARVGFSGFGLDALRVVTALALSDLSFRFIESPIRRRRRLREWRGVVAAGLAFTSIVVLAVVVVPGPAPTSAAPAVVTLPPPPSTVATTTAATTTTTPSPTTTRAGAVPAPTSASTSTTTTTTVPAGPVRVLVSGDSTGQQLAKALIDYNTAHPDQIVAGSSAFPGCGLTAADDGRTHTITHPDGSSEQLDLSGCLGQWNAVIQRAGGAEHIDVVLVCIGPWDSVDIHLKDGRVVSVGDPVGYQIVVDAYTRFVDAVEATGVRLAFVTPADSHIGWGAITATVNEPARWSALRSVLDALPVTQIDLPGFLAGHHLEGQNGRPDGVHLDPQVEVQFVDEVVVPALRAIGPRPS